MHRWDIGKYILCFETDNKIGVFTLQYAKL